MPEILGSPSRYVQGAGVLDELGTYSAKLGKKALIIATDQGLKRLGDALPKTFQDADCAFSIQVFRGESSKSEIERMKNAAEAESCDVVVGIGGGKLIDTAKAAAYYAKLPVVVMPTAASSDAPCSSSSVIYTDEGVFEEYLYLPTSPDLVIVDSNIIAHAPARLLAAGMGDAMATYFEARAVRDSYSKNCLGGYQTVAAMALAEACYQTLLDEGLKAVLAAKANVVTPSLEKIIEANTYLSGVGFESGGLAVAHAVHNGLTAIPATRELYHGEKVAFGLLTQLVMEDADDDEIRTVVEFCMTMGLPVTFEELGIEDVTDEELKAAAELAAAPDDTAHNMPFPVTARSIYEGMIAANATGAYYTGADQEEGECGCGHHH